MTTPQTNTPLRAFLAFFDTCPSGDIALQRQAEALVTYAKWDRMRGNYKSADLEIDVKHDTLSGGESMCTETTIRFEGHEVFRMAETKMPQNIVRITEAYDTDPHWRYALALEYRGHALPAAKTTAGGVKARLQV